MARKFKIQLIGKFKPGQPDKHSAIRQHLAVRGWWAALSTEPRADGDLVTLAIKVRPVLTTLAVCAASLYLAAGFGLAQWLGRSPYNRIGVTDLLWPGNWKALRGLRGEAYCAQGRDELNAGRIAQGIFYIRLGLVSHPNDASTRFALARIYAKAHHYTGVRDILLPQLAFPPANRPVLQLLLDEATQADDWTTVVAAAEQVAKHPGLTEPDRRWLRLQQARGLVTLRRAEDALVILNEPSWALAPDVMEWRVASLVQLGRAEEAVGLAQSLPRGPLGQTQTRLRILVITQRLAMRKVDMDQTLRELIELHPDVPEPRLFAMEQYWMAGETAAADREFEDYRRRFSMTPKSMSEATRRLAAVGAADLVERAFAEARALGQPVGSAWSLLVIAQIRAADWTGLERTFSLMFGADRPMSESEIATREWLRAVLLVGREEKAHSLDEWRTACAVGPFSLSTYQAVADGLARSGRWRSVLIAIEAGLRVFPQSEDLRRKMVEATEKTLELKPEPVTPLASNVPKREVRDEVGVKRRTKIGELNARTFLAQLAGQTERREWEQAATFVSKVRSTTPMWWGEVAVELDWQEAKIASGLDDRQALIGHVLRGLRRNPPPVERALDFARDYAALGRLDDARQLTRKILEALPQSAVVRRYAVEIGVPDVTKPKGEETPAAAEPAASRPTAPSAEETALASRRSVAAVLDAKSFSARLAGQIERGEWNDAAALISAVRSTTPTWWGEVAVELTWQEAKIAMASGDRLAVIGFVTQSLRQSPPPVARAVEFSREYGRQGQREDERRLAMKILEAVPQSAVAKRYLAEIEAIFEQKK